MKVWGCFSSTGVGNLYWVKGTMDKFMYKDILKKQMYPSAKKLFPQHIKKFILLQDNDPKHTAKIVKEYLSKKKQKVLDFPP